MRIFARDQANCPTFSEKLPAQNKIPPPTAGCPQQPALSRHVAAESRTYSPAEESLPRSALPSVRIFHVPFLLPGWLSPVRKLTPVRIPGRHQVRLHRSKACLGRLASPELEQVPTKQTALLPAVIPRRKTYLHLTCDP